MTPASSVLLLTTLTGFGYGLLAWLGLFDMVGLLPRAPWFLPVAVVIALAFASGGLLASMLHLGRPERAWRAFSQWRSSWLSRGGGGLDPDLSTGFGVRGAVVCRGA